MRGEGLCKSYLAEDDEGLYIIHLPLRFRAYIQHGSEPVVCLGVWDIVLDTYVNTSFFVTYVYLSTVAGLGFILL